MQAKCQALCRSSDSAISLLDDLSTIINKVCSSLCHRCGFGRSWELCVERLVCRLERQCNPLVHAALLLAKASSAKVKLLYCYLSVS